MSQWQLTRDVHVFTDHALPLLKADPVANTVALTVLDWLLGGRVFSDATPVFAWYDDDLGETSGAVLMTPPYDLLLAALPAGSVPGLVSTLRSAGADLPGARGDAVAATTFAEAWTAGTDLVATPTMQLRLYGLATLAPPTVTGHARRATTDDTALVTGWWDAFHHEADGHRVNVAPLVTHAIDDGLLWLWTVAGEPVAMAAGKAPVAGCSRIGTVYTPPDRRSHGFGSAVTAACAADALDAGADHVLLFTDLSNPVSNAIYQRIGFEPISDTITFAFTPVA